MADQRSLEMHAFNFSSRTFAHRRNYTVSLQISNPLFELRAWVFGPSCQGWECYQFMDAGIAANNGKDLTLNILAVFKCIRQIGLRMTIEKRHFRVRQVEFPGKTFSSERISPQTRKIHNFPDKLWFPKSKKALQRYLGFVNYNRKYIPRVVENIIIISKLLKLEVPNNIYSELKDVFVSVNEAFSDACQLALKQQILGKQLVLRT